MESVAILGIVLPIDVIMDHLISNMVQSNPKIKTVSTMKVRMAEITIKQCQTRWNNPKLCYELKLS